VVPNPWEDDQGGSLEKISGGVKREGRGERLKGFTAEGAELELGLQWFTTVWAIAAQTPSLGLMPCLA